MKKVCSPYFDPEFDTLQERINGPTCRVTIDNESLEDYTVIKVDSINKQGLLLEVVQVLMDMNLLICKSYISSDAGWFMDVFHVRDEHGNKLTDQKVINYIQQAIGRSRGSPHSVKAKTYSNKVFPYVHPNEHTTIEMTGSDRHGLFSEISAALADLRCNIIEAHAWTHNARLACIAYISDIDESTLSPIEDPRRLAAIEDRLTTVLRGTTNPNSPIGTLVKQQEAVKIRDDGELGAMSCSVERRLHQMMVSVRDFEAERRIMRRRRWLEEMGKKTMEYFIRHMDGYALSTESEKERVAKCLVAAIERRVCEGIRVELCAKKRVGLQSDITRMLRENGLAVIRADVETHGDKSVNGFYVRSVSAGNENDEIDDDNIEYLIQCVKREMAPNPIVLRINNIHTPMPSCTPRTRLSLGDKLIKISAD